MELKKMTFDAACKGDPAAIALMQAAADEGSKDAEAILLQLTRENMAKTGEKDFTVAFNRVAAANSLLHIAYLNGNSVKA